MPSYIQQTFKRERKKERKKDNANIPTTISEIQNVVLEAHAERHMLRSLPIAVDSSEVCNLIRQVSLCLIMSTLFKHGAVKLVLIISV